MVSKACIITSFCAGEICAVTRAYLSCYVYSWQGRAAATVSILELTKHEHEKMIAEKVAKLEELITIQDQQADQLAEFQQTIQTLKDSVVNEKQRCVCVFVPTALHFICLCCPGFGC